jgi:hypothetical protein
VSDPVDAAKNRSQPAVIPELKSALTELLDDEEDETEHDFLLVAPDKF